VYRQLPPLLLLRLLPMWVWMTDDFVDYRRCSGVSHEKGKCIDSGEWEGVPAEL